MVCEHVVCMADNVNGTEEQREHQLAEVARMYLAGRYQVHIAKELGITQQQVSYDLKVIRERWVESSLRDFDELKAQELAKIDDAEREFRQAWERSKNAKQITHSKKREGLGASTEAGVRKEEQVGDPRFLDGVLKCIHMRCELLGLNAAKKVSLLDGDGNNYGAFLSEDERRNRLLAAFLEQGAAGSPRQAVM